jgi:CubicO group peptidase (beta-lactamase class C family)
MPHLPLATPAELDFDPQRLQVAYDLLQSWTTGDRPPVPSGAILVGRWGKMVEPRFFGRQGPEPDAPPIRDDSMFLLASITKPVTYMAAMLLVERGLLNLSDPVVRYLPEFAAHHKEETLVQHLFTHTSGLPDMLDNNVPLRRRKAPLSEFIRGAIRDTVPLFAPGTNYSYQSMGTLVVAELVQQLAQTSIHEFLAKEIFAPLDMRSSALGAATLDRRRLVRVQTPDYQEPDFGWNSVYWQDLGAPWGGMFSSPADFAVLCQLLLNGGEYAGVRLLAPTTVAMMTSNRLDDYPEMPEAIRRAHPWGLGWKLNQPGTSDSLCDLLGRTAYGHTGATGTLMWIDPQRQAFFLLFTSAERSRAPWRLVHLSNAIAAAMVA